jgi:hypothetical protein
MKIALRKTDGDRLVRLAHFQAQRIEMATIRRRKRAAEPARTGKASIDGAQ